MAATVTFQAVSKQATLTRLIIDQIESMISDRHLTSGDKLPSERDLAAQFGVSRTVVREAVAALSAKGLLESQANGGLVISSPSAETVSQSLAMFLNTGLAAVDYAKVHEVRRVLEVEIASLAAQRRTPDDLAALEGVLKLAPDAGQDRHTFAANDLEFHAALARATQNELFVLLMDSLSDVLFNVRATGYDVPDTPARALRHHTSIFEAVRAADVKAAVAAMVDHIKEAEETQAKVLLLRQSELGRPDHRQ